MIHSRRRNRSVIFRLSDEEYDGLGEAASRSHVRSVSEFIRMAVMSAVESGDAERTAPGSHSPPAIQTPAIQAPAIQALQRRIRGLEETLYRSRQAK